MSEKFQFLYHTQKVERKDCLWRWWQKVQVPQKRNTNNLTIVEIRLVLSMSRFFYCEEQSLGRHHLLACDHLNFIAYQTYIWRLYHTANICTIMQCTKCKYFCCGLHLDWSFFNLPFYLKASIKVACSTGVDAIILPSCDTHCLRMLSVHLTL